MKLQYTRSLASDLSGKHLLLDTTAFINASKSDEFLALLTRLVRAGCTFVTIPSVIYEFSRGARTMGELSEYLGFIEGLRVAVLNRIEESMNEEMRVFLFERTELITIDVKGSLRNEAIYTYSEERFSQVLVELEQA